jgi:hypothetical protein
MQEKDPDLSRCKEYFARYLISIEDEDSDFISMAEGTRDELLRFGALNLFS